MTITKNQALAFLKSDVLYTSTIVSALAEIKLTQNEFDALVSFAFNVGTYHFAESTLLKKLNADMSRVVVAAEFGRWVYSKGKILDGLVKRRDAEAALFLKG